jgi:hypothetical protein
MASRFMEDVVRNGYSDRGDRGKIQRNKVSTLDPFRPLGEGPPLTVRLIRAYQGQLRDTATAHGPRDVKRRVEWIILEHGP